MNFDYIAKLANAADTLDKVLQPPWSDRLNCNDYLEICRCRNLLRELMEQEVKKMMSRPRY